MSPLWRCHCITTPHCGTPERVSSGPKWGRPAAKGTWQAKHVPPEGYSQLKLTLSILVLLHVLDQERAELMGRDGELAPFVPGNDLGPGDKGL